LTRCRARRGSSRRARCGSCCGRFIVVLGECGRGKESGGKEGGKKKRPLQRKSRGPHRGRPYSGLRSKKKAREEIGLAVDELRAAGGVVDAVMRAAATINWWNRDASG